MANPAYHADPADNPETEVAELVATARASSAFLIASPAYHDSYSGALKNALDNLSAIEFRNKPTGLLAHGSGLSAVQVCDQLRTVMRSLFALTVPEQLVTVPEDYRTDASTDRTSYAAIKPSSDWMR